MLIFFRVQRYAWVSPSASDNSNVLGARFWDDQGTLQNIGKFYRDFPTDGSASPIPANADKVCHNCSGCKVNVTDGSC